MVVGPEGGILIINAIWEKDGKKKKKVSLCLMVILLANTDLKQKIGKVLNEAWSGRLYCNQIVHAHSHALVRFSC